MSSSFSLSRFGVISLISRWRCAVWLGGSNEGSCSLNGNSFLHFMMMSLTSSLSKGAENFENDPLTTLHDKYVPDGRSSCSSSMGDIRMPHRSDHGPP